MKRILKLTLVSLILIPFLFAGGQKGKGKIELPGKVKKAFKKALKKGEFKNPYKIQIIDQYNFKGTPGSVFVVLLFKGDIPQPKEGENNYLYAKVIRKDGGYINVVKVIKGQAKDFYSFVLFLPAGEYRFLMGVGDKKGKKFSMIMTKLKVESPEVPGEITHTKPMFIKNFVRGSREEVLREVIPDAFYSGMIKVFPYRKASFKADQQPIVFMFLYGLGKDETGMAKGTVKFTILKDGKEFVKFKEIGLKGRGGMGIIDQPSLCKKEGKPLPAGKYELEIKVKDEILNREINVKLPFEII